MNVEEVVEYWVESAAGDWPVASHLFNSGDIEEIGEWLKSQLKQRKASSRK